MKPNTPIGRWFKSSYSASQGDCVEVAHLPVSYRKSSFSQSEAACVEVADLPDGAAMRDTKHPELGALVFPGSEWQAFLEGVHRSFSSS